MSGSASGWAGRAPESQGHNPRRSWRQKPTCMARHRGLTQPALVGSWDRRPGSQSRFSSTGQRPAHWHLTLMFDLECTRTYLCVALSVASVTNGAVPLSRCVRVHMCVQRVHTEQEAGSWKGMLQDESIYNKIFKGWHFGPRITRGCLFTSENCCWYSVKGSDCQGLTKMTLGINNVCVT